MKIVQVATSSLVPYAQNSRTHSKAQIEQIAASITEFGFTNPVLLDDKTGVIAGHGRVLAAELLTLPTVPCIRLAHLSEAQKKAYIIADNKLAENSGWDEKILRLELSELDDVGFDLNLLGWEPDQLKIILSTDDVIEGLTDPNSVPDIAEDITTELGDVWILGNHTLICGDCTDKNTITSLMGSSIADMLMTDPPYNIGYTGGKNPQQKIREDIQNDQMTDDEFLVFLESSFSSANSVLKPGGAFYIWHSSSKSLQSVLACKNKLGEVRMIVIWNKHRMAMSRQDYHPKFEPCLYGWKSGAAHLWTNDRKQVTVLDYNRPSKSDFHPTMKPVEMIKYLLTNNTRSEHIVLDIFGGSGSTLIACEQSGRFCRMVELSPKYCDVIVNRWQNFTGRQAVHAESQKNFDDIG